MTEHRARRFLAALAALTLLASAFALPACRRAEREEPRKPRASAPGTPSAEPTPSTEPTPSAGATPPLHGGTVPGASDIVLNAFFVKGETLYPAARRIKRTPAVASALMAELVKGPGTADKGLTSAIPKGTDVRGIKVSGGTATVDLSEQFASGGGSLSMRLRVAQVVYTLTQFSSVQRVAFRIDGRPVESLGGEGLLIGEPQTRADHSEMLPPILIESPAAETTATSPLRVRGWAHVFEGFFRVQVVGPDGTVLADKGVQGRGDQQAPFDVTLTFTGAKPGAGKVVGYSDSPKDGSRINVFEVPVRLP